MDIQSSVDVLFSLIFHNQSAIDICNTGSTSIRKGEIDASLIEASIFADF